ncbi:RNA polymerase sigma factor [Sunxiuqinia sp. A32]|uniref:RNA polymerase sigma factor n=1 Tax=Sunxiuqinia sp. A32 TaxID=3461496 RepID=UPI00404608E9
MPDNELQQLIDGCQRNDRQSQKLLYQRFYGFAMKICLRFANNQNEAVEVLNDGFFKAFTNIDKYDEKWAFKAWLSKIMQNSSIDYYRSNLRWSRMEELEQSDLSMNDAVVEGQLGYEDLLSMVQQLPPTYRLVFNLYAIDGYSHEEISKIVGISIGTSRSNLFKARKKLQLMLTKPKSILALLIYKYRLRTRENSHLKTLQIQQNYESR